MLIAYIVLARVSANLGAIPHLFERLFLISWENNRDCHITMPLSLKTMEVQIKEEIRGSGRCRSTEIVNASDVSVKL